MINVALIDISHFYRTKVHAGADRPMTFAADETMSLVHGVAQSERKYTHIICCFDMKPYNRNLLDPSYKANREGVDPSIEEQYLRMIERVKRAGYHAWGVKGYEADDIIASACAQLPADWVIDIHTGDKDLLQLVDGERVCVISTRTGDVIDTDKVLETYGIYPSNILLYLALQGDRSDNVPGIQGIGPKKAAFLAKGCKTIEELTTKSAGPVSPQEKKLFDAVFASIDVVKHAYSLIKLERDAPLPITELTEPKENAHMEEMPPETSREPEVVEKETPPLVETPPKPLVHVREPAPETKSQEEKMDQMLASVEKSPGVAMQVSAGESGILLRPGVFLTKTTLGLMLNLAKTFHESGLYRRKFDSPQAIFAVMELGVELGISPQVAVQNFHMIEGKPSPASHFLISLAQKDSHCIYFECVEESAESVTYATKKKFMETEMRFTYSLKDAQQDQHRWANGAAKNQRAMLRKTAGCQAARLWYPGATCGLYGPAEMGFEEGDE
jgi:5'-3' exonuclease